MNLQLYLKLGMKLRNVHRVLAFNQKRFFKPYTDWCTAKRAASSSEFEKRLMKLLVNSTFGKTIQNMRDLLDCKFCVNKKQLKKWLSNPRFCSMKIISEELVIVFLKRTSIFMNKPYPCGFTILERSKYFMYQQFYEIIKPTLGNCTVLMSDTDSFVLQVKNLQKTKNISKLKDLIDFSNYPKDNPLYSLENKNKLGFWKDELRGDQMTDFCGLRSKTYAFLLNNEEKNEKILKSKCKGVTKSYRKKISFANYKKCVMSYDQVHMIQYQIQAKTHKVRTVQVNKLCFSSFDDKRHLLNCGVHSLPYGSKLIKDSADVCPLCKLNNPLLIRYAS